MGQCNTTSTGAGVFQTVTLLAHMINYIYLRMALSAYRGIEIEPLIGVP